MSYIVAVSLYHTHFVLPLQLPGISKFLGLYKLLLLFPAQISRNETLELREKEKQMLAERERKMHCLYNPSLSGTITISSIRLFFFSIKPLTQICRSEIRPWLKPHKKQFNRHNPTDFLRKKWETLTIKYVKFKFCKKIKLHCELNKCNKIAAQNVYKNQTEHTCS